MSVEGVGQGAEVVTLPGGGIQSASPAYMHYCDPHALLNLGGVFQFGATKSNGGKGYPKGNWKKIPIEDHLNKAMIHMLAYLAGDVSDDHLGHAQCRVHMALAMKLEKERDRERARMTYDEDLADLRKNNPQIGCNEDWIDDEEAQ